VSLWNKFLTAGFGLLLTAVTLAACGRPLNKANNSAGTMNEVTVYVSTDRVFSEPILKAYEQKSAEVEKALAKSEAVQIPLHAGVEGPKNIPPLITFNPMTLDYGKAASRLEDVVKRLQPILGL
jgi:hypothetical protein